LRCGIVVFRAGLTVLNSQRRRPTMVTSIPPGRSMLMERRAISPHAPRSQN
jgi:hypothetical protein